ncbi:hypothetical protein [Hyalangium sp.]|uniref:hypothetical protein n=1 Tax=Hyalangium sp. TaxID=2028555 RepID=UPI002D7211F6|nr:hypothetical protein [Hyalangium sp.]HYH95160.1 hypothetical protein [Hyalangium sp.]
MTFKRWMVLGAVASALAFTGCQDRSRDQQDLGTQGAGDPTQVPATGGSGTGDSTLPSGTDPLRDTPQDARPGTELEGTGPSGGAVDDPGGTGGSGTVQDPGTGGSGTVNDPGTAGDVDQGVLDERDLNERDLNRPDMMDDSRDDSRDIGGSGEEAR